MNLYISFFVSSNSWNNLFRFFSNCSILFWYSSISETKKMGWRRSDLFLLQPQIILPTIEILHACSDPLGLGWFGGFSQQKEFFHFLVSETFLVGGIIANFVEFFIKLGEIIPHRGQRQRTRGCRGTSSLAIFIASQTANPSATIPSS